MKRFTSSYKARRFYMYWRSESDRLTFAAICGQDGFVGNRAGEFSSFSRRFACRFNQ